MSLFSPTAASIKAGRAVTVSVSYNAIMFASKIRFTSFHLSDAAAAVQSAKRPLWFLVRAHFSTLMGVIALNASVIKFVLVRSSRASGKVILILFKEVHLLKIPLPRDFTADGIVMLLREVQPLKILSPTNSTEDGMEMVAREMQLEKTLSSSDITEDGMTTLMREVQRRKTPRPSDVTDGGTMMDFREVQ